MIDELELCKDDWISDIVVAQLENSIRKEDEKAPHSHFHTFSRPIPIACSLDKIFELLAPKSGMHLDTNSEFDLMIGITSA